MDEGTTKIGEKIARVVMAARSRASATMGLCDVAEAERLEAQCIEDLEAAIAADVLAAYERCAKMAWDAAEKETREASAAALYDLAAAIRARKDGAR